MLFRSFGLVCTVGCVLFLFCSLKGIVDDALEVGKRGLEESNIKLSVNWCLIRCITIIINEIAAHPPDFTELFAVRAVERLEWRIFIGVDERVVVVVHVVRVGGIWMKRCTQREGFEDGFDCKKTR